MDVNFHLLQHDPLQFVSVGTSGMFLGCFLFFLFFLQQRDQNNQYFGEKGYCSLVITAQ